MLFADAETGVLGPDVELKSWHLDCISIYNDLFQQPEGITLHFRSPTVANDSVVDIECLLL
jgi:hypothetical protein